MMHNRHLDTFLAAAKTGSFRKAADQLYISSSAVIQQIDLLERELQVTLFVRTRRGLRLTPAGEYLVEEARSYIDRGEQIRRYMAALNAQNSSISVGTSEADKCRLLYDLWIMFSQEHKGYDIRLLAIDGSPDALRTAQLIESIRDGVPWQRDWEFMEICRVPVGCAVAKDHPCYGKDLVTIQDMRENGVTLIDRSGGDGRAALIQQLNANGIAYESYPNWSPSLIWECSLKKKMLLVPSCWDDVLFDLSILPCALEESIPYGLFYREEGSEPLRLFLDFVRGVYSGTNPYDIVPVL